MGDVLCFASEVKHVGQLFSGRARSRGQNGSERAESGQRTSIPVASGLQAERASSEPSKRKREYVRCERATTKGREGKNLLVVPLRQRDHEIPIDPQRSPLARSDSQPLHPTDMQLRLFYSRLQ